MCDYGTEILVETARFWISRVAFYENRYHSRDIVGPDEYHHGVTDNAFTNWMVRHNLEVSIKMATWLAKEYPTRLSELSSKLDLVPRKLQNGRKFSIIFIFRARKDASLNSLKASLLQAS